MAEVKWWKEALIYQIYPRSFKDSNGDGIGDLKGIISKIDYIASLGIDVVWLNPVYSSPNEDNGYDISDYTSIMTELGTMEDFDLLLNSLHARGIRLIMDLVINHTSDEHHWFTQARTSRENPYYNFYHWWPEEKGTPPVRESFFDFRGMGWEYNKSTRSWYLHYFSPKQPDLNWENEHLRKEIYIIIKWWLQKGVDGFRLDAITFISKDTSFPEIKPEEIKEKYQGEWSHYYATGPHLHEYLKEMQEQAFSPYQAMTLAEGPGIISDQASLFVDADRGELDMFTHFEGIGVGYVPGKFKKINPGGYDVKEFIKVYTKWNDVFSEKGWPTLYLGNHDQPRMVSRWGNDSQEFRKPSSKMLFTFLLSMRATPFIYNGDEIGMTNIRFDKIDDYRDVETKNMYERLRSSGGDTEEFLQDQRETARDNSRTPIQWNDGPGAGYTEGTPWIRLNDNYRMINAADCEKDPDSILQYFRKMISLRKKTPVLVYGDYNLLESPGGLYIYIRSEKEVKLLVILNFSKTNVDYTQDFLFDRDKDVLINNYPEIKLTENIINLFPYQALIINIK